MIPELKALKPSQKDPMENAVVLKQGEISTAAYDALSLEEKEGAKQLKELLKTDDTKGIINYGLSAQEQISDFSEQMLSKTRTKDLGAVGGTLNELMVSIQESNPNDLVQKPGLFAKMFRKVNHNLNVAQAKYQSLAVGMDKISLKLQENRKGLMEDSDNLDEMYNLNLEYFHDLNLYIAGGELKLKEIREETLPELKKKVEESNESTSALAVQETKDMEDYMHRLEKRIFDLQLARQMSIQQAPQIRLIQNSNIELAEKIQSSINTAIPLWKNQVSISLALLNQKDALQSQRLVTQTTNDLMLKNSQLLNTSSIEIAKENERGFIEIETLKTVQANLIDTIKETQAIQRDGSAKREAGQIELAKMEQELKASLLETSQPSSEKKLRDVTNY